MLTSHMGVAYASGLSKNGSWADEDAVVPVMKVFALYSHDCFDYPSILLLTDHLAEGSIRLHSWAEESVKSCKKC